MPGAVSRHDDAFQAYEYWPIRVRLLHLEAFTVWGSGEEDQDAVLVSADGRAIFTEPGTLGPALLDLTVADPDEARRERLRQALETCSRMDPSDLAEQAHLHDFPAARRWIAGQREHVEVAPVLDVLNLMWDMARCLSLEDVQRALLRGRSLGKLADRLTEMSLDGRLSGHTEAFLADRRTLLRKFDDAVRRLVRRTVLVRPQDTGFLVLPVDAVPSGGGGP